jgi:nitrite reductase (NO-forming)
MIRPRETTRLYQTAARAWLTAAAASLLLPEDVRLGLWLPLHLAVAGAASVAISGAMQNFATTLTATPPPAAAVVLAQFGLANLGALLVAVGRVAGLSWVLAVGGSAFVAAVGILGWMVGSAWRRSLQRRHAVPLAMYGFAISCGLVGATFGWLMGSGLVDAQVYNGLRRAHMVLNVLGWTSGTIVGTLITLLPTVLRVRMPRWHGGPTMGMFAVGVVLLAAGLFADLRAVAAIGAVSLAASTAGVLYMAGRVLATPRRWPVPAAAGHLIAALAWFVFGIGALGVAVARGGFDGFRGPFLTIFVGAWVLQTLLGAWSYLLPMGRPAHPDDRRRFLAATEVGGRLQVLVLNLGLALVAMRSAGWIGQGGGTAGAGLALGAGLIALAKAWAFPVMAGRMAGRMAAGGRPGRVWGG